MKSKPILAELFKLDKDAYENLDNEAFASEALRNNSYFLTAVAEMKAEYVMKEDNVTANPSFSFDDKVKYREYYSMLRLLLDGVVIALDSKMMMLENNKEQ